MKITGNRGFTLIEIMAVVAIIAILLAVALPSYQSYMRKTKRSAAKGELMEVLARQEQFFTDNKQYATDLTNLGYFANPYAINEDGTSEAAASADRIYLIQFAAAPAATTTSFTLEAVPQLDQTNDSCGTLTLTSLGAKDVYGGGTKEDCWR